MSKAILVIDMPKTCEECPICQGVALDGDYVCSIKDEYGEERGFDDGEYEKPDWCPLKTVPEKQEVCGRYNSEYFAKGGKVPSWKIGWNDCIDEILKEGAECL